MTLEEFYKATEDMPSDMEIGFYNGGFNRPIKEARIEKLWVDKQQKDILILYPKSIIYH